MSKEGEEDCDAYNKLPLMHPLWRPLWRPSSATTSSSVSILPRESVTGHLKVENNTTFDVFDAKVLTADQASKTYQEPPDPNTINFALSSEQLSNVAQTKEANLIGHGIPTTSAETPTTPSNSVSIGSVSKHLPVGASMATWAERVPGDFQPPSFDLCHSFPFQLDLFQLQAAYFLDLGFSIFCAAHTSAGKTAVAEYAIALALNRNYSRCIYTSPIKALSNQKFRELGRVFGRERIGLITGDTQINTGAAVMIMTTEILRSILYHQGSGGNAGVSLSNVNKSSPAIENASDREEPPSHPSSSTYSSNFLMNEVDFVIFDEVHYVNDLERGVVWEEVLIMLPKEIQLVLLSATVPNCLEFAEWIGRQRSVTCAKDERVGEVAWQLPSSTQIKVIQTNKRPIPLEHFLYIPGRQREMQTGEHGGGAMIELVNDQGQFLVDGYREAIGLITGTTLKQPKETTTKQSQKQQATHAKSHAPSTSAIISLSMRQQGTLWIDLIHMLKQRSLLPTLVFLFSRRGCEEAVDACPSLDLSTAQERAGVRIFLDMHVMPLLSTEDQQLPQVIRVSEMLARGIAVHHSGLLPILKEAVEVLFSRGLVKVLFVTETFAMGVNMPARAVVFGRGVRKHDGVQWRQLSAGEYTQMAGRAGRRGKDVRGTVIIVTMPNSDYAPSESGLRSMILGEPNRLDSRFRLTYNMILSLLKSPHSLRIEEMIKRSFRAHASQKALPQDKAHLEELQQRMEQLKIVGDSGVDEGSSSPVNSFIDCIRCTQSSNGSLDALIDQVWKVSEQASRATSTLWNKLHQVGKAWPLLNNQNVVVIDRMKKVFNRGKVIGMSKLSPVATYALDHAPWSCHNDNKKIVQASTELVQFQPGDVWWTENDPRLTAVHEIDFLILEVKGLRTRVKELFNQMIKCPDWQEHWSIWYRVSALAQQIAELRFRVSDHSLDLLPEYNARVQILRQLGYLDALFMPTLKGRVASEICTTDELVTTELVFGNVLKSPAQVMAILSTMIHQERPNKERNELNCSTKEVLLNIISDRGDEIKDNDELVDAEKIQERGFDKKLATDIAHKLGPFLDTLDKIISHLNMVQNTHGLTPPAHFQGDKDQGTFHPINPGIVMAIYAWCIRKRAEKRVEDDDELVLDNEKTNENAMSFAKICELTEEGTSAGSLFRSMNRLWESAREVRQAGILVGDTQLIALGDECAKLIRRGICLCTSLYYMLDD